jgi:hypothetical protein
MEKISKYLTKGLGYIGFCGLALNSYLAFGQQWKPFSVASTANLHSQPFGYNRATNHRLYLCRANLWGSLQLGITWGKHAKCELPYANKKYSVDKFSILKSAEDVKWQNYYGYFPKNAFILGSGIKSVPLAVCRGYYKRSLLVGKTWRNHGTCDAVYLHSIQHLKRYSILIHSTHTLA